MIASFLLALQSFIAPPSDPQAFSACLETPGGPLSFGLEFTRKPDHTWTAFLINGEERIEVPTVTFDGQSMLLDMPHYASRISAHLVPPPASSCNSFPEFAGTWTKTRSATQIAELPFHALQAMRFDWPLGPSADAILGRWSVQFAEDPQAAVGVFTKAPEADHAQRIRGTFLTATGDYRYLSGGRSGFPSHLGDNPDTLWELSCFDGAHAFLFKAKLQPDGTLAGDFWSGNWSHETWTAKRDDNAHLDDPFAQTHWNGKTKLADLSFPDLDGKRWSLGDPKFAGKGYLLVVFGSWCPNCNDEAQFLAELDAKYRVQGLRILGLAFELTGERDANQVRIFAERHKLTFPMFLCGTNDKDEATKALNLVDQVRAFPTTIFVGADGLVRAIHSGYAGPATGEEHVKLRADFERRINELLGTKAR